MDLFYNLVKMRQNYVLEINPGFMNVRLLLVCSILAIAPLSGCIGDDSDSSDSESMCTGGVADQELIDLWIYSTTW